MHVVAGFDELFPDHSFQFSIWDAAPFSTAVQQRRTTFNSLFEMLSAHRGRWGACRGSLSILYLRCSHTSGLPHVSRLAVSLSILYLRCFAVRLLSHGKIRDVFQFSIWDAGNRDRQLYSRLITAFNSLFEMQHDGVAVAYSAQFRHPFNSLFEMRPCWRSACL